MYKPFIFLLLICLTSCYSHKKLPTFGNSKSVNSLSEKREAEFTLVVFAGVGCGYSQLLLKDLILLDSSSNINKVAVIYEGEEVIRKNQQQFFNSYTFYSNKDLNLKHSNFYPQSYLYKNGNLIWKHKGYQRGLDKVIIEQVIF